MLYEERIHHVDVEIDHRRERRELVESGVGYLAAALFVGGIALIFILLSISG